MKSKPVLWFSAIFSLSMAVGLLAGKSVNASFRASASQAAAYPALQVESHSLPTQAPSAAIETNQIETPAPKSPPMIADASQELSAPEPVLKFNQRNLLVVQVDSLRSARPRLQAIWLAIYLPEMSQVMLLPLYPSLDEYAGSELEQALQTIREIPSPVDDERNLDPKLVEALRSTGLWWEHTLVFDYLALIELLETYREDASPGDEDIPVFDPLQVVSGLAAQSNQPETFLKTSAMLFRQICPVWAIGSSAHEWSRNISNFSPLHIKSDLPLISESLGSAAVVEQATLSCHFPSLAIEP